jgi:hypothetical protein
MALHTLVLIAASFAQPHPDLEVGVATSYVRGGGFDGPGIAVQSLWSPNEYFALGPVVDVANVSEGSLRAGNRLPASYAFTSTLAGGIVQLRLPLPLVEPFAALGFGYLAVSGKQSANTQCGLSSGPGAMLAVGGRAAVSNHLTLGLRGSARSSSTEQTCGAAFGPAVFNVPVLFALGSTLDYRW